MTGICPNCERDAELTLIRKTENIDIRDDLIPVDLEFYKCSNCEAEFRDPQSLDDPLEIAYREYRKRHRMLQPEEIKQFRNNFGLTQQELSSLLGWGGATLSRYENGALQDDAHDTVLKLVMEPSNLLDLLRQRPGSVSVQKREKLMPALEEMVLGQQGSFLSLYEAWFGSYDPDEFSGYRPLDISKLLNAMLFFCLRDDVPKTKLNKLLFYADFKHFKEYTVSITGAKYAHLPFGPAPDQYQHYLASLYHEEGAIAIEEREFDGYMGEYLASLKEPNYGVFVTSELKVLALVKEYFEGFTASRISAISHQEKGYIETRDGELISYKYAEHLDL